MNQKTQMDSILRAMTLAPSAHNTQPWKFKVGENSIDVFIEWSRHLKVSDPTGRQMYISLGCTIENGVVAAEFNGSKTSVILFPEGEAKDKPVARLLFSEETNKGNGDQSLYEAIQKRRTDRSLYDGTPLSDKERNSLKPSLDHSNIFLVEEKEDIARIAKASGEGNFKQMGRPDFKQELSKWVRNNWTTRKDGMPGYALGIPAVMSLVSPIIVKVAPIHKEEGPKTEAQVNSVSGVIVIATITDEKKDWVYAGQLMERVWLQAHAAGLAVAPLAPAIEAGQHTRDMVHTSLPDTSLYAQVILRVGHSHKMNLRSSPRRSINDCLVKRT